MVLCSPQSDKYIVNLKQACYLKLKVTCYGVITVFVYLNNNSRTYEYNQWCSQPTPYGEFWSKMARDGKKYRQLLLQKPLLQILGTIWIGGVLNVKYCKVHTSY